jgi:photosystem II stability/assembly factor-like uncharacterized protein
MKKYDVLGIILLAISVLAHPPAALSQPAFNEDFLKFFSYRSLGPARQGGRILDIAVPESQPYTFYVASASGGLWKTENNGTTFEPIFDKETTIVIGDIDIVASNPDIVWVGTGEPASGRITLLGDGVFKSLDGGKTWAHMGLHETRHIGRVAIHPGNPDIVYVAAVGYHFSFNAERGLFKTEDGGTTWQKVLFISEKVGVVDVALNPKNLDIVYAATYDKWRLPWHFEESGPESAIYKSTDAGKTWARLGGGFPTGKIGRISLDIFRQNPDILYARVENNNKRPPTEDEVKRAKEQKREPEGRPIGGEIYRSDDAGQTWSKMNSEKDNPGASKWYGQIAIDPNDDQVVYVPDVRLQRSTDGGKTWGKVGVVNIAPRVHVDHHVIWIDPRDSNHLILGNDGGLAASYDGGKTWDVYENLPLAQFYAIGVDNDEPYNIYGGAQDTGSYKIPSNGPSGGIGRDDWTPVGGGDGMFNLVDPADSRWLCTEAQFGSLERVDQKLGLRKSIRPARQKGAPPLRFHWTTPVHISPHNTAIIYCGSNVLFRSLDRGDNWQEISPDLTSQDPEKLKGNIEHCIITTISESPRTPGVIWVGTDDGKLQLTKNGGGTWEDLTANLAQAGAPQDYCVSRVIASSHEDDAAYVAKTGFQRDEFTPHLYKTVDYGKTWVSVASNLPKGILYVVVEDRKNPNLLFVGKETGVFVTIDGGKSWLPLKNNMPTVPVFDLLIHPRENDLVVGSHGRGIFVTDIAPLQELDEKVLASEAHLFEVEPRIRPSRRQMTGLFGDRHFSGPNEPDGLVINYYLKDQAKEAVKVEITTPYGEELATIPGAASPGLHRVIWDMRKRVKKEEAGSGVEEPERFRGSARELVPPGEYTVILRSGEKRWTRRAVIRELPGLG